MSGAKKPATVRRTYGGASVWIDGGLYTVAEIRSMLRAAILFRRQSRAALLRSMRRVKAWKNSGAR